MPDTGAPWNIPYVEAADLVSDWPADSLALANAIDAGLDAALLPGIGSNVVQTVKDDDFTTTSTSFTDITGLTATITPSSASSKILVQVNLGQAGANGTSIIQFRVIRDGTPVGVGSGSPANGWALVVAAANRNQAPGYSYLDSPATASAVTYEVQMNVEAGDTGYINRGSSDNSGDSISTITLVEVAA